MEQIIAEKQRYADTKLKEKPIYELTKRVFDFISSLLVSIIISIPCLIIAVIIIIVDPGNPFYVQERMGRNGKTIKMVKFRSMIKNAGDLEDMLTPEQYEQYLKEYKLDNDPRLLPRGVGKMIRKLSIDELPQIFFNICLGGSMSVVGPRPIVHSELLDKYTLEQQKLLLSVKPGLTGYWQAYARNNASYESGRRQKMELYYIENRSVCFDIRILFQSVISVLKRTGAQ